MYIIYAPNVRSGGGLILLQALLSGWRGPSKLYAILDSRAQPRLTLNAGVDVHWISPGLLGRLSAELMLPRVAHDGDCVLCFHGLPPIMVTKKFAAKILVFVQNRLVIERSPLRSYPFRVRIRILLERFLFRSLISYADDIVVQGQGMQRQLMTLLDADAKAGLPRIHVRPFAPPTPVSSANIVKCFDFIYPASGDAHKNHAKLIEAWESLKLEGIAPSLALTLGPQDQSLWDALDVRIRSAGLNVVNIGSVDRNGIIEAYWKAKALIFPSTTESFGLPLIEAAGIGLPIIAGELDFVRDVCKPVESFDPGSAVSIARAVKRFLRQPEEQSEVISPEAFWATLTTRQA